MERTDAIVDRLGRPMPNIGRQAMVCSTQVVPGWMVEIPRPRLLSEAPVLSPIFVPPSATGLWPRRRTLLAQGESRPGFTGQGQHWGHRDDVL